MRLSASAETGTALQTAYPAYTFVTDDFEQMDAVGTAVLSDASALDVQALAAFGLFRRAHADISERV